MSRGEDENHEPNEGPTLRAGRFGWLWIVATPAFLIWAAFAIDLETLGEVLGRLRAETLTASIAFLVANLGLEALWLAVILGGRRDGPGFDAAIHIAGWHALAVTVLPGRAGDLLWVLLIRRRAGLTTTHAAVLALLHRLQDVIAVAALFCIALALASRGIVGAQAVWAAAIVLPVAVAVQGRLNALLAIAARLTLATARRAAAARLRRFAGHLIQVRRWRRRDVGPVRGAAGFAIIGLRWFLIGLGLFLPLAELLGGVAAGDGSLIVSAYILLGMIPLHTVGGYGAGEAGLASLLTVFGVGLAAGAATALVLRTVINLGNLCGWALGLSILAGRRLASRDRVR